MLHMRHSNQSGFTIVELMVTTFVMFIVVVVFGGIISASYRQAIAADALASMTRDMHVTMDAIEMDVLASVEIASTSRRGDMNMLDRYGYSAVSNPAPTLQTWKYFGGGSNKRALLLIQYATNLRRGARSREVVYAATKRFNCSTERRLQPKYRQMVVYFMRDNTLYRRVIFDDIKSERYKALGVNASAICGTGDENNEFWRKIAVQSIPPQSSEFTGGATLGRSLYRDETIARNVSAFDVQYFKDDTPIANQYDAAHSSDHMFENANKVKIDITISPPVGGVSKISQSLTVRKGNEE